MKNSKLKIYKNGKSLCYQLHSLILYIIMLNYTIVVRIFNRNSKKLWIIKKLLS